MTSPYDLSSPMNVAKAITIYEYLRPMMPPITGHADAHDAPRYASRLRDVLSSFDALLLDGFGVLNIGPDPVAGADDLINTAKAEGITTMVLTNGASKDKAKAGIRYQQLGIDITPEYVMSSRDALLHHLAASSCQHLGVIDSFTDLPTDLNMTCTALDPSYPEDWQACDAIGFFGAVNWDDMWQASLTAAIASGTPILVANPDVTAPLESGFTREPGFWIAHALNALGMAAEDANIQWYGKPYPAIYDLAAARLEALMGRSNLNRKRIAMVGDTLHTDILGGHAAGMTTVLITGHGLFRDGGADDMIKAVGITPDVIVDTV